MTDWQPLSDAIARFSDAYLGMLAARAEERENSKKWKAAHAEFEEAHAARYEAAMAYWTEEDGYWFDAEGKKFKSAGAVIRRYYSETVEPKRGGK
jgi:hypothetical protein